MIRKELQAWLDEFNNVTVPALLAAGFKPTPTNAREGLAGITSSLITDIPAVAQIYDDIVYAQEYNVPVRIYNPAPEETLPVLIYYHGGGHMSGSVTVYDPICRKIATKTKHIVVAPEYRLAPENPYPAGVHDAFNTAKYVWSVLDGRKIKYKKQLSLVGDSGGGALVATVSMRAQFDGNMKIKSQSMIYPSLDYTMQSQSMKDNGVGYLLAASKIAWYFDNYFQHAENRKAVSPLYWEFGPNLPRTQIFTAQYCPLLDEGLLYVKKAKAAGICTEHYHFDNMIHTFMNMENLCREEVELVYAKMNEFLNKD